jgi:hypothetical protein
MLMNSALPAEQEVIPNQTPLRGNPLKGEIEDTQAFICPATNLRLATVQVLRGTRSRSQPLQVIKVRKGIGIDQAR